ncbi:MAG: hypothetical protein ACFFDT_30540, partial [Candidatus Hodarchaeota archaeon]
ENPEDLIKCGTSSDDYLRKITNNQGFTLVCEMPYFYDKDLGDDSLTEYNRRKLRLDSLEYSKEHYKYNKEKFQSIRKYCDPTSRIFTSTLDYVEKFEQRITPQIHHAKTASMYEGNATVAQAFDSMVAVRYYDVFRPAMIARLCNEAIISHPELKEELKQIKNELDQRVEQTVSDILKETNFEVIPIKKLVKVQVGSTLTAIQYLSQ